MFEEHKPPIGSYIFALLLILLGGWIATHKGWGGIGGIVIGVSLALIVVVSVIALLREWRQTLKEAGYKLEAETQRLIQIEKMSEEDKAFARRDYRIGLAKRVENQIKQKEQ